MLRAATMAAPTKPIQISPAKLESASTRASTEHSGRFENDQPVILFSRNTPYT
jgi:hypothetical protein